MPVASRATANNTTADIGTGTERRWRHRRQMALMFTLTGVVAPAVTATVDDPAQLVNFWPTSLVVSAKV